MNTLIDYQYTDAANFHSTPEQALDYKVIVSGELTPEERAEIISYCEGDEYFIPSQVGLPDLQFYLTDKYGWDGDDHVFHRLAGFETTADEVTTPTTTAELLAAFRQVNDSRNWDVAGALRRLGHDQLD